MSPVHRSPYRAVGIILVEEVIVVIEEHHTIRIVHPVGFRCKVEEWTVLFFFLIDCFFSGTAKKEIKKYKI